MNPYILGIVNAIVPGLSYLILRKRQVFGSLLLIAFITSCAALFFAPDMSAIPFGTTYDILNWVTFVLASVAFGYDAYALAKAK